MSTENRSTASSDRKKRKKKDKPKNLVMAAIRAATNPPPPETTATFLLMADRADWVTGRNVYISKATIAMGIRRSPRMVQRFFKILREGNYIERHEPDNLEQFKKKFPYADERPDCYRIVLETLALKPAPKPESDGGLIYWDGQQWTIDTKGTVLLAPRGDMSDSPKGKKGETCATRGRRHGRRDRGDMSVSQPLLISSSKRSPSSLPSVPSEQEGNSARSATTPNREAGGGVPEQGRAASESERQNEEAQVLEVAIYTPWVTNAALKFLGEDDLAGHDEVCHGLISNLLTDTSGPLIRTVQDILLIAARIVFASGDDEAKYKTDENERLLFRAPLDMDLDFARSLKPANFPGCRRRAHQWLKDFDCSETYSRYSKVHGDLLKNLTAALRRAGLTDALQELEGEGLIDLSDDDYINQGGAQ